MAQPSIQKKYYDTLLGAELVSSEAYIRVRDALMNLNSVIVKKHMKPVVDASGIILVVKKFIKTHDASSYIRLDVLYAGMPRITV